MIRAIYARIEEQYKQSKSNHPPCLAIIHANDQPDSQLYIKRKIGALNRLRFQYKYHKLHSVDDIATCITSLNHDQKIHGIIIQSPLFPEIHHQFDSLSALISPEKDVDGLTTQSPFVPCTASAVLSVLSYYQIDLKSSHSLVIGRSKVVGAPIAKLLGDGGATVTIAHSDTPKRLLSQLCQTADIIVLAVGQPAVVHGSLVKPGAVVIDVGVNYSNGTITGDCLHPQSPAYSYTPVPGGIGPVTVASLVSNLLAAYTKLARQP